MAQSIMTPDDVAEMRQNFFVRLDDFTDDQLISAFAGLWLVVWKARQWGWHDTEVRDEASAVIEAAFGPQGW